VKPKTTPANPENPCGLAIIEGALCRLNRKGRAVRRHRPLGTAVVEFAQATDDSILVREWGYGFLPGLANLYCLDAELNLRWLAELPAPGEFFETLGSITDLRLSATTQSGLTCQIDLNNGRVQIQAPNAAAV